MPVKPMMEEIEDDIVDIANTEFSYYPTTTVPPSDDPGLSYEKDNEKKGKVLTSCVLYVDIRNSVALTEKHTAKIMGKIYTAFTKGVIKAARHHGGHTRNIIGDRVMIVFPEAACFTNAVKCAISINHIAGMINKKFTGVDFKCGIGIDYGKMRITKVGVPRKGKENQPSRGLVWAGTPANIASRLTDMGNKTISETRYELQLKASTLDYMDRPTPSDPNSPKKYELKSKRSLFNYINLTPLNAPNPPQKKYRLDLKSLYDSLPDTVTLTEAEFLAGISVKDEVMFYKSRKITSLNKKTVEHKYPAILMTERVYNGLVKEGISPDLYAPGSWQEQTFSIRDVKGKVYGGTYTWKL